LKHMISAQSTSTSTLPSPKAQYFVVTAAGPLQAHTTHSLGMHRDMA